MNRYYRPAAAGSGRFNDHYAVRGGGRMYCAELRLSWDQADRLADVFNGIRQEALRSVEYEERAA